MANGLSIEEFDDMKAKELNAPISTGRSLSVEEFDKLKRIEGSINNGYSDEEFDFENDLHRIMSKGDMGFFESIGESFKQGDASSNIDIMGYHALTGQFDYGKDVKPIRDKFIQRTIDKRVDGNNFLSDGIYAVSGMLPAMGKGTMEGLTVGMTAATAAAIYGQAGLQVLVPEEAFTVPGLLAAGTTAGSATYWYKQGAGSIYIDLKEEGVDDNIIAPIAHIAGALYGAVEFSQFTKLIPGGKEVAKKMITNSVRGTIANMVKRHGLNWINEVGEEGIQEVVMSLAQDIGTNIGNKTNKTIGDIVTNALTSGWGAIKGSAIPMLLLLAPKVAIETKRAVDFSKEIKAVEAQAAKIKAGDALFGGKTFEEEQMRSKLLVDAMSGIELSEEDISTLNTIREEFIEKGLIEKEEEEVDASVEEIAQQIVESSEIDLSEGVEEAVEEIPEGEAIEDISEDTVADEGVVEEGVSEDVDVLEDLPEEPTFEDFEDIVDKELSGKKLTLEEQQASAELDIEFEKEQNSVIDGLKKSIKGLIRKEAGEEFRLIPKTLFSKDEGIPLDSLATENEQALNFLNYEVSADGMREFIRDHIGQQGEGKKIFKPHKEPSTAKSRLREVKRLLKERNARVSEIMKGVLKVVGKPTKLSPAKTDKILKPEEKKVSIKESKALVVKLKAAQKASKQGARASRDIVSKRIKQLNDIIDQSGLTAHDKDKFRKTLRQVSKGDVFNEDGFNKLVNKVDSRLSVLLEKQKRRGLTKQILKRPKRPEQVVDVKYQNRIDDILGKLGDTKQERRRSIKNISTANLEKIAEIIARLGKEGRKVFKTTQEQRNVASEIIRIALIKEAGGKKGGELGPKGSAQEKKAKRLSKVKKYKGAFVRPLRMIRQIFGKTGEKLFYDSFDASEMQRGLYAIERQGRIQESMKRNRVNSFGLGETISVGATSFQVNNVLRMYLATKDEKSLKALIHGNNISEDLINEYIEIVKTEKPEYIKFADEVQEIVAERYGDLSNVMEDVFNAKLKKVNVYFPLKRLAIHLNEDDVYQGIESELIFELGIRSGDTFSYTSTEKNITITRKDIDEKFQTEISLDFIGDAINAINTQEQFISHSYLQKAFNKVVNDPDIKDAVVYNHSSDAWKDFNDYLKAVINPVLVYNGGGKYNGIARATRHGLAKAFLGYNVVTAGKQLPSLMLALKYTSPGHMLSSMRRMALSKKARDRVFEMNPSLTNRIVSRDIEELLKAIKNLPESDIKRRLQAASSVIDKTAFAMIMQMDKYAVLSVYDSVYRYQRKFKSESEARNIANKAVLETQPQAGVKDLPAIYRENNDYLRMILMFTNQLNQVWNMISADLPAEIKNKEFKKASVGIASIIMSSVGIYIMSHGRLPEDLEELFDAVFGTIISSIPVVGNWGMSMMRGYDPSISPAESVINNIKFLKQNIENENYVDALKSAQFILSVYAKLPYSQPKRTLDGAIDLFRGNTTDLRRLIWSESQLRSNE